MPVGGEQAPGGLHQRVHGGALVLGRVAQRLGVATPRGGLFVGAAERVAGAEQVLDGAALGPDQLVDGPGGHRGLAQGRHFGGILATALLAQGLCELRALGNETIERNPVEIVDIHRPRWCQDCVCTAGRPPALVPAKSGAVGSVIRSRVWVSQKLRGYECPG